MFVSVAITAEQPRILPRVAPASAPALNVRQMTGCPRAGRTAANAMPPISREYPPAEVRERQPL